ncbi:MULTISPECIES: hypothetical protein [unclassified Haloferax]|jgi:hypothetical protein|uniref:hypothetical protein n=1 Tax=unclassified Haloferax TaxID=2625095 RepID=UPI0028745615|nr:MULTISPECIES: hypothetical protein [unclassified Haloferax]MDS0243103.1 hypothetical protein [Haloferax sp. S2CR25]MDS0446224.1 hypothetical protein [Haloferax sp. S2CR25-2]
MKQSELAAEPPHANKSWHTVEDERWQLENATSDRWHVASIAIVENPGHAGEIPLEATLEHDTGAVVECTALDPWEHFGNRPVIRAHRVRLESPTEDTAYYLTIDEDGITYVEADRVEKADAYVKRVQPDGGRPHFVRHVDEAKQCICVAALRVSRAVATVEARAPAIADYGTGQAALGTYGGGNE